MKVIAGDNWPFLADVNNVDAMLYHKDVGPVTFYGLGKNDGPKKETISKNLTTMDWQKVYEELSCLDASSCGKPITDEAEQTSSP